MTPTSFGMDTAISRRAWLRLAASGTVAAAVGVSVILAACGGTAASTAPAAAPGSGTSGSKGSKLQIPSYVPQQLAKADLPGNSEGLDAAYYTYPRTNPKTVPNPPGKGGDVGIMVWNIQAPLIAVEQNPARQELNKQVGANIKIVDVPFADYNTRFSTTMAGNDFPDMFFVPPNPNVEQLPEFLASKCADLTDLLSGDAVKAYPNLANFPPMAWPVTVFNNRLWGVPINYGRALWNLWTHAELLDQTGGQMPKSADDFKRILQDVSKSGTLFGMGVESGLAFNMSTGLEPAIFGAPNNWQLDPSGKLLSTYETDQYKQALAYTRDLFTSHAFAPDSNATNNVKEKADFAARKTAFRWDGWVASPQWWDIGQTLSPPTKLHIVPPFSADGKTKPTYWLGPGNFGFTAIKKASADRVKELLGILNFLAAPFGSAEHLLINYGVKDVDYKLDANGNPVLTDKGKTDTNSLWTYICRPPTTIFDANAKDFANLQTDEKAELAAGIADPTTGYYSPTYGATGRVIAQKFNDTIAEIVSGTRPLSDYDAAVKDWRAGGGDKIKAEYQALITADAGH